MHITTEFTSDESWFHPSFRAQITLIAQVQRMNVNVAEQNLKLHGVADHHVIMLQTLTPWELFPVQTTALSIVIE